jgi:hypothetical protein
MSSPRSAKQGFEEHPKEQQEGRVEDDLPLLLKGNHFWCYMKNRKIPTATVLLLSIGVLTWLGLSSRMAVD